MITNLIRFALFTIIVIAFICFYDSDFLVREVKENMETIENKYTSSIQDLPVKNKHMNEKNNTVSTQDHLKQWMNEQGDQLFSQKSTPISDLNNIS